ncbi:MAG: hypothetical protein ACP5N7_05885 [Candidatus Pacearchaeota archaeon]
MKQQIKIGNFNIKYIWDSFKEWFGTPNVSPKKSELKSFILPKPMSYKEIFEEYSPNEISLDELAYLLKNDEELLKNGYPNIFYIKDNSDVLRAVHVRWSDGGWLVDALSVGDSLRWYDGNQMFSRNSALKSLDSNPLSSSDTSFLETRIKNLEDKIDKLISIINI